MTATTNDVGRIELGDNVRQMVVLQSPGSATYAVGTLMATKAVSSTLAVAYTRAGSSTYTVAATMQKRKTLKAGAYTVTAGTLAAGIGRWTVSDPDGNTETFDTLAAADHIVFAGIGLILTVTAGGGTVWDSGDVITVTVTADGDTVIFDPDGNGGAQTPTSIMPYEQVVAGTDMPASVITGGKVNKDRLVIHDTTTVTDVHVQMLKDVGIFALDQEDVSMIDNVT